MAHQWYKDKLVIIGVAAGLAALAGLVLAYSSAPARESSDDKGDMPPEETQKEGPDAKVSPPQHWRRARDRAWFEGSLAPTMVRQNPSCTDPSTT